MDTLGATLPTTVPRPGFARMPAIFPHPSFGRRHEGLLLWLGVALVMALAVAVAGAMWNAYTARGMPDTTAMPAGMTQSSTGGTVSVNATWAGMHAGPVFTVAMYARYADLNGDDLTALATLRASDGREVQANGWHAPAGSGQRIGTLTFPTTAADGKPLLNASTRNVTLIIRNVGGVPERDFTWTP